MQASRYECAWIAASASRKIASVVCARLLPGKAARKTKARKAANAMHDGPNGKRDAKAKIREIWATGKYSTRDRCAEEECSALNISHSTARRALYRTPDPG